jgi:uncharacterized membrane protein YkoI
MSKTTRRVLVVVGTTVAVAAGTMTLVAAARNDSDTPITGPALTRAMAAAVAFTKGGRVTGTEVDDEDSKYEVEVTLADGRQVDVQLDEQFQVVDSNAGTGD